jgi:hypothetical protein
MAYAGLAKALKEHGFRATEAALAMKLKRGSFAASFFLACLAAIGLEGMRLEDV